MELQISVGGARRRVPLERPVYRIGRQDDNDIVIDDKKASRRHCVLEKSGDEFVLRDLESRNGTWMGEERVREAHLAAGDSFRIGRTVFQLVTPGSDAGLDEAMDIEAIDIPPPKPAKRAREPKSEFPTRLSGPVERQLRPLREAASILTRTTDRALTLRNARLLDRRAKPLTTTAGAANEAAMALLEIVLTAIQVRVSDVFIEPGERGFSLRARIDGLLQPMAELTQPLGLALLNVIKVLCQIDLSKRSTIQEGTFMVALPDRRVDLRVSILPVSDGQKAAIRVLDKARIPEDLAKLGMDEDLASEVRRALAQDAGMIVVSGPTGSGKTTTLYTILQGIDAHQRNVVTIEDPIEYRIDQATQIAIDPGHQVTFASVLASVLRQNPDVILVGEVRDKETASLAMHAASTGHLVLTTAHARDALGTIFRLLDLGIEPVQIAGSMSLAVAQRLVRVLCPHCKRPFRPDARMIRDLRIDERQQYELCMPVGCAKCMQTGYSGRMAIFEVMRFTPALRDVILTRPTVSDIRKAAGDWLFRTLADSGRRRVLQGLTSMEEVERVASGD